MRRRAAIVFIPEVFYYLSNIVRMLPAKVLFKKKLFLFLKLNSLVQVQLLITDFFDTGIDDGYDNSDS